MFKMEAKGSLLIEALSELNENIKELIKRMDESNKKLENIDLNTKELTGEYVKNA